VSITPIPFVEGRALAPGTTLEEARRSHGRREVLLWLDVAEPDAEELRSLGEELDLPELALEDLREGNQRPKVDQYEDWVLIVAYAASFGAADERVSLNEVDVLVGRDRLVTVRQRPALGPTYLRERVTATGGRPLHTSTALAHAVLDGIVDGYFAVTDEIESRIEALDDRVWDGLGRDDLTRAFALRRDLARFRRVVAPVRELLTIVVRREHGVLDDTMDEHLRDLYDHVVTVHEEIEMSRELLASTLEGHLSLVSNRMNETVLKVSAWAAIIAVPTVIASIYGMNFRDMPELAWRGGYPAALGLMATAALALYVTFKRRGWL
jgi:magnesium transporter